MERLTTNNPDSNMENSLNLFYIKDGTTWVRGGGTAPDYPDIELYDFIKKAIRNVESSIDPEQQNDGLGECLYESLFDGTDTLDGIIATLYTTAWAFSMLREKLSDYENTGIEPNEVPTGLELANVYAALEQLKRYEAVGTVEQCEELHKELVISKAALCEMCRVRSAEQNILCGCFRCKYGGNQNAKL